MHRARGQCGVNRGDRAPAQDPVYQTVFKICTFILQPDITGPLYVRLAFHDAATWNRNSTRQGGCAPASGMRSLPGAGFGAVE